MPFSESLMQGVRFDRPWFISDFMASAIFYFFSPLVPEVWDHRNLTKLAEQWMLWRLVTYCYSCTCACWLPDRPESSQILSASRSGGFQRCFFPTSCWWLKKEKEKQKDEALLSLVSPPLTVWPMDSKAAEGKQEDRKIHRLWWYKLCFSRTLGLKKVPRPLSNRINLGNMT